MTVAAEQHLARDRVRLHVDLVADAVARLAEHRAVLARGRLHVTVVVGIARVDLEDLVVDVGDHARRHDAWEAHRLELQPRLDPVGVREEDLVRADADLLSRHGLAADEVGLDQLPG